MDGYTGDVRSSLPPGTYTYIDTDSRGCSVTGSVVVAGPFSVSVSQVNDSCYGDSTGSITLTPSGGSAPYTTGEWLDGPISDHRSGLPAGAYSYFELDNNGCWATGAVTITQPAPNPVTVRNDTICAGQPATLSASPLLSGGTFLWMPGGAVTDSITVSPAATSAYGVFYSLNGCTSHTLATVVVNSCMQDTVWPGDANNDLIVDNLDLLTIGLGYDSSGPARINATIVWQGQQATPWNEFFTNYTLPVNYDHADCNGDGIINANDTLAIMANFGLTHAKSANPIPGPWRLGTPGLTLQFTNDTLYNDSMIITNIFLGDSATPVSGIYGLAFTLNYDPMITDSVPHMSFIPSWLGDSTNSIHIAVVNQAYGTVEAAITGIDHMPRSGYGQIAVFSGEITTGNINGKTWSYYHNRIYISDITAIDQHGNLIPLNAGIDSNYVGFFTTGIKEPSAPVVSIYPNPANTQVRISADAAISQITITDIMGKNVRTTAVNGKKAEVIDISALAEGLYMVHVSAAGGNTIVKMIVSR